MFQFLHVMNESVWSCILSTFFVSSLVLWFIDRFSPYSYQNNMESFEEEDGKKYFTLKESLWFCLTTLTPQGGGVVPKNWSGRLMAATWWLLSFITVAQYTANFAAYVTLSRVQKGSLVHSH